jgi:CheY-like chemotaxis protein
MRKINDVTILVVDDNKENLAVVGNLFKDMGYKLAFALNGPDALEIASTNPISLILLDIMMPGMDGFEVCNELKNNPKTREIPIIFLTAKVETDDIVTGFLLGGVDYMTKPFKKEELIVRVNNHLDLIRAREIINYQAEELRKSNKLLMNALHGMGKYLNPKE